MKLAIACLVLSSSAVFAAAKKEIIQATATIPVLGNLECHLIPTGNLDSSTTQLTVLEPADGLRLRLYDDKQGQNPLQLEHKRATALGCDLKTMNAVVANSGQFYGFAMAVPVELIKETIQSRINGFGQCFAVYSETIHLNISKGTKASAIENQLPDLPDMILTSENSKWIPTDDCQNK